MQGSPEFPHRFNADGTIDSICPHCFATIATCNREADLNSAERVHVCDSNLVHHYRKDLEVTPEAP